MAATLDAASMAGQPLLSGVSEPFAEEAVADASEAFSEAATAVVFFVGIFLAGRFLTRRRAAAKPAKRKVQDATVAEKQVPEVLAEGDSKTVVDEQVLVQERESAAMAAMFDRWIAHSRREQVVAELPVMINDAIQNQCLNQAAIESRANYLAEVIVGACVARGFFGEAVSVYEQFASTFAFSLFGSSEMWSALLSCAVSSGQLSRCATFWSNLRSQGLPSQADCANIMKYHAYRRDVSAMSNILAEMACFSFLLDKEIRLAAVSACVAKDDLELAEAFAVDGVCDEALDAPVYQLLMQGHAARGDVERCQELIKEATSCKAKVEDMRIAMLIGLMEGEYVDDAATLFGDLRNAGTRFSPQHSIAFVRAAVEAGDLTHAATAMEDYFEANGCAINFATQLLVVRAYVANGGIAGAVRMLETLISQGVSIDDVVMIILNDGCQRLAEPRQLFNTFHWLANQARESRASTLTSLLKVLCTHEAWAKALELIEFAPKIRLQPTADDFEDLVLSSAEKGAFDEAFAAYTSMIQLHSSSASKCAYAGSRLAQLSSDQGHTAIAAAVKQLGA